MSEAKGPYRHSTKGGECVASCNACIFEEGRASRDGLREASQWALEFFKARDEMNAKVHCSPTRLSPITERFMKALEADGEGEK